MNTGQPTTKTITFPVSIPPPKHFSKNTFASCPCANESAHKRKYEAVFEMAPKLTSSSTQHELDRLNNLMYKHFSNVEFVFIRCYLFLPLDLHSLWLKGLVFSIPFLVLYLDFPCPLLKLPPL